MHVAIGPAGESDLLTWFITGICAGGVLTLVSFCIFGRCILRTRGRRNRLHAVDGDGGPWTH